MQCIGIPIQHSYKLHSLISSIRNPYLETIHKRKKEYSFFTIMFRPNYLGCLLLTVSLFSVHGMRRRHVMSTSFIVPQTHRRREVSYRLWQSVPQPSIPESHTKVPHASYFAIPCSTPQSVPWFPALICALLLLVAPGPSQAGLLEDYGGSSSVTNPTTVTPTASGGNKGSVQIDPTLRGCTCLPAYSASSVCSYSHQISL